MSGALDDTLFRRCPGCGAENPPALLRCGCGALLTGVDLTRREPPPPPAVLESPPASSAAFSLRCPHEDCAQESPPGSTRCLYCNRPLPTVATLPLAGEPLGLLRLPPVLAVRFSVVRVLPATGAEAELILVAANDGTPYVAKVYRHGVTPRPEVRTRIAALDPRHCVHLLDSGIADGHAWELMEYCAHGSLRNLLAQHNGLLPPTLLGTVAGELAASLAEVHAAGLVHRDLKPENVLIRALEPLDLVLTDFGIASVLDATQRFTGQARTLPYAAPESLSGVIDGKTDYWALGMILLEGALGRHPFAGLSEAVILHHLTTKSIDTSEIADARLRKLVRGLLLRDPGLRWGAGELARWRRDDETLAEPIEHAPGSGFAEPYRLAGEICRTPQQLAVAMARHWREGVRDLDNGQFLEWFRKVQKDHDTVRLLIDLRHEQQLHVDVQLLRLIVHLAPGLPPVWRGENIELAAILAAANRALKGDADAAAWLDTLYRYDVLNVWSAAGNAGASELVTRWHAAADRFADAWRAGLARLRAHEPPRDANDVVHFDDVVFGRQDPPRPSLAQLHPRFLAVAYDAQWAERLRQRLLAALAEIAADCSWLGDLGDPQAMAASELLVLESLLPEARKTAEKQRLAAERRREADIQAFVALRGEVATGLETIRASVAGHWPWEEELSTLSDAIDSFRRVALRVRSLGRDDEDARALRQRVARVEPLLERIDERLIALRQHMAINRGWLHTRVLAAFAVALLLLPIVAGNTAVGWLFAAGLALIIWRLGGAFARSRELRRLLGLL